MGLFLHFYDLVPRSKNADGAPKGAAPPKDSISSNLAHRWSQRPLVYIADFISGASAAARNGFASLVMSRLGSSFLPSPSHTIIETLSTV